MIIIMIIIIIIITTTTTIIKCTEQRHTRGFNFTKDFWKWMNSNFAEDFAFSNNNGKWYPRNHSDFILKLFPQ